MPLSKPTLIIELGLTAAFNAPLNAVVWTNITPYVVSWGTGRGRQPSRPPAHFEPGVANVTLNNRDRRFDPTNAASPYHPNLKPARVRFRIRATWAGVTYGVICGYVKRWPPKWTASATSTVDITVVDATGAPLNLPQLAASAWQTVVRRDSPRLWLRLGESQGPTAYDATKNRLNGQYQGAPTFGLDSLVDHDADKAAAFGWGSRVSLANKNLIAGYPFTFECWMRANPDRGRVRMLLAAYTGPISGNRQWLQFYINTAGKLVVQVVNPNPTGSASDSTITVDDGTRHHLAVVMASSTDMKIYIDGVNRTLVASANAHAFPNDLNTGYAIGNSPAVAFGDFPFSTTSADVLDEVAIYDYALPVSRIAAHHAAGSGAWHDELSGARVNRILTEAGWATNDRVVDAGQSKLQSVTSAAGVVSNLQKVEESEQGALFVDETGRVVFEDRHKILRAPYTESQATFGQGAGDLPYEAPVVWGNDDAELFNEASGNRANGPTFTVVDEASQDPATGYGERPLANMDGLLNMSDGEVVDLLTYRVSKLAQPVPTVRQIRLHPAAVPELYPKVLGLGLRSRITVKVAPPGGGAVFSQQSHIERISHEVDDLGDWWTIWDISAADTATFLTLDDPARGLLDSGNRVAF